MNKADFEAAININYWQQEVGQQEFINTWSVKGPILVTRAGEPVAVWTDKKTLGYPLEVMVNTLVLKERYNIETKPKDLPSVAVIRLSSSPLDPFETRREVLEAYLRRGNNPLFHAVTDNNIFNA